MLPGSSTILFKTRHRLNGLLADVFRPFRTERSYLSAAGRGQLLIYHGVCDSAPSRFNTLFITVRTLEAHLRLFKKYCHLVSLDDFYEGRFASDRLTVCLTFDDGFANNYHHVLPLITKYQIPAAFFVTGIRQAGYDILWNDFLSLVTRYGPSRIRCRGESYSKDRAGRYVSNATKQSLAEQLRALDFIAKKEMMEELARFAKFKDDEQQTAYWQQMTEQQLGRLTASPWTTIGSHGYYHNDLSKIPVALAKSEMLRSKQYLEQLTGKEIKALAFPYGTYTTAVKEVAKNVGYSQLLATELLLPGDENDRHLRQRLTINPFISPVNQLYAAVNACS